MEVALTGPGSHGCPPHAHCPTCPAPTLKDLQTEAWGSLDPEKPILWWDEGCESLTVTLGDKLDLNSERISLLSFYSTDTEDNLLIPQDPAMRKRTELTPGLVRIFPQVQGIEAYPHEDPRIGWVHEILVTEPCKRFLNRIWVGQHPFVFTFKQIQGKTI